MSDGEFEPLEPQYPPDFDPAKFVSPELFLKTLEDPSVVYIGSELNDDSDRETVQDIADSQGWDLGFLTLGHAASDGWSRFPVYRISVETTLKGSDGAEYGFKTPYTQPVNQDHLNEAERIVASAPGANELSTAERSRRIVRWAMALAAGGEVIEVKPDDHFDTDPGRL